MQAVLDGGHGQPKGLGDVAHRAAPGAPQEHDEALRLGQPLDGAAEAGPAVPGLGHSRRIGARDLRLLEARLAEAARPPPDPVRLRHDDAAEPGGERRRVAQLADGPPGRDEGLLGGVLGEVRVPEHAVRDRHRHPAEADHDLAEGGLALRTGAGAEEDAHQGREPVVGHPASPSHVLPPGQPTATSRPIRAMTRSRWGLPCGSHRRALCPNHATWSR